jgi:uncharacterized paraquat-inducible protein A
MNIITALCIVSCILIICVFTLFLIVYLSELKREKHLRKTMLEANEILNKKFPVMMVDLPIKSSSVEEVDVNKNKRSVN